MTPEEVRQAINERKVLYYLEVYDHSASFIRKIKPTSVSYSLSDLRPCESGQSSWRESKIDGRDLVA